MTYGQHIELFAGTGAAAIPLNRLGFETIAWAECERFCQRILSARFPSAHQFEDVVHVTRKRLRERLDGSPLLVSGGFPCQDVSGIGRNAGLRGLRSGLWSEFARIIEELRPEYVVIENVAALRVRGLDQVLADLHRLGYNARWDTIPAAAAGAPHRRARLFIVACPNYGGDPPWWDRADAYAHANQGVWCHDMGATLTDIPAAGEVRGKFLRAQPRHFPGPFPHLRYPTPRHAANEWRTTQNAPSHGNSHGKTLAGEANDLERARGAPLGRPSESCGNVSPGWVEWIMGLPIGWTDPLIPNNRLWPHGGWEQVLEPLPRTAGGVQDRRGRLMALGNGLVPQQFALALEMLLELSPAAVA